MNIEFKQFLENFQADVASLVYAEGDGAVFEDKFTEYCVEILEEAGETEAPICYSYVYPGELGKDWKINGYALRDNYINDLNKACYETLDLFVSYYQHSYDYNITREQFNKRLNQLKRFINGALKGHIDYLDPSNGIYDLIKLIYNQGKQFDRINIYYLINGSSNQTTEKILIKGFENIGIYTHVWDIQRFFRLKSSLTDREAVEINVLDFMDEGFEGIPCLKVPDINDLFECYLAIVPGSLLSKLYREYSSKLLESNVRAFLGQKGKKNIGIRDTVRTKPYMFLPYNNGISATADFVEVVNIGSSMFITKLNDFQIVNGGQTTASLYHTEKNYKDVDLSQIFVQMKLTVIKDVVNKNIEVPYIAQFANTQNPISPLDLSANSPYFVKIEELSRRKYVRKPGNNNDQTMLWFFERVNGQYRELINRLRGTPLKIFKEQNLPAYRFLKADVTKWISLWELEPHAVSSGTTKNFAAFEKKIKHLIGKNKLPGENLYKVLIANAIIYKSFDRLYGKKNADPIGDTNIKSMVVAYSVSYFHYLTERRLDLWKIYEDQKIDESLESIFRELLMFVYTQMTKSATGVLFSEYAKKESSWITLRQQNYSLHKFSIEKFLVSTEEAIERQVEHENVEVENEIVLVSKIISLGTRFWDGLKLHIRSTREMTDIEFDVWDICNKIDRKKNLDNSAIRVGKRILTMIQDDLINIDQIKGLSTLPDENVIDLKSVYDRMSLLKKEQWSRIISLSEQTQIFDSLEISNLKSVQRAILTKDKLKEASLLKANDSLMKLRKFNIEY